MIESRTWQDFVEDMFTDGKTINEIRIVAFATRWRNYLPDIIKYAKKLKNIAKFNRIKLQVKKVQKKNSMCITCINVGCENRNN